MRNKFARFAILPLLIFASLTSFAQSAEDYFATPSPPDAPLTEAYSQLTASQTASARRLSRFFLVEQPSAIVSTALLDAFKRDPPGGLVFWNFSHAGWQDLAKTTARYSQILKENGQLPAFFSIDDEGGGLTFSPSGRNIPGIQRFRQGFTDLAHGVWLGKSLAHFGTELCDLHGRIMGQELAAAGVNFPLTLVSDLAQRLFILRGVSIDPTEVATCLKSFTKSMASAGPVIAVTKHFPGLGQNSGDTHDVESISTAKTLVDADRHLFPFRDLINFANSNGLQSRLSVMSSHGKFPLLDPNHLTTESSILLDDILRDRFGFQGVRVSDAMWMGGYGNLQGDSLYAVYVNAFVSGLDILMIPGSRFGGALRAFQQVDDGSASTNFRLALEARSGLKFDNLREKFGRRVTESLGRIDFTLRTLPYSHETVSGSPPRNLRVRDRARYYEILRALDSRWSGQLPAELQRP